jgi:hypothetical protein
VPSAPAPTLIAGPVAVHRHAVSGSASYTRSGSIRPAASRYPGGGLQGPQCDSRSTPPASLRSGAGGILTSAARSVGEVRIPEAERPRHIYPGQSGCQAGITLHNSTYGDTSLCSHYARRIGIVDGNQTGGSRTDSGASECLSRLWPKLQLYGRGPAEDHR